MKNIYKALCFVVLATFLVACPKDDDITAQPALPYSIVYPLDLAKIDNFLDTHYLVPMADVGDDVVFEEIPVGGTQTPIRNMIELGSFNVEAHDITYKVYYLNLREGTEESTTRLDSAFISYKGVLMNDLSLTFDSRQDPVWFELESTIRGWGEVIPKFKTGTHSVAGDGSVTFNDFGVGVMFLPSGLAYYNQSVGNIPAYSPLIFNFRLFKQRSKDHDRDGILSKDEYGGTNFNALPKNTDGDSFPDYLDLDDDNDGWLTKKEISKPLPLGIGQGTSSYYPYNPIADDLSTPEDETEPKGIPDASGDGVTPTRLRRHLDRNAKPPYLTY